MKDIYSLKLHEDTTLTLTHNATVRILRVPGGWLYRTIRTGERTTMTETFVPYVEPDKSYEDHLESLIACLNLNPNKRESFSHVLSVMEKLGQSYLDTIRDQENSQPGS